MDREANRYSNRHSCPTRDGRVASTFCIPVPNRRRKLPRYARELASRRDVGKVEMSAEARALFEKLREHVFSIDRDVLELAEPNSVSYHSPTFFLEILPRRYTLTLLLALDFNEIDDPTGVAQDATQREFFIHARHEGGVAVSVGDHLSLQNAIPLIPQAHAAACG